MKTYVEILELLQEQDKQSKQGTLTREEVEKALIELEEMKHTITQSVYNVIKQELTRILGEVVN